MKKYVYLMVFLFLWSIPNVRIVAQDIVGDVCAALIFDALESIEMNCAEQEDGTACYAHPLVEAEISGDGVFSSPGDQVELAAVTSIRTHPVNVETGEWGIAVLTEPTATEADDTEGETLSYIMMGDTQLTAVDEDAGLDAFTVQTAASDPDCLGAPNKFVIQAEPDLEQVDLTVNGVEIQIAGETTVVLDAIEGEDMTIMVVTGEVVVVLGDETQIITSGEQIILTLEGEDGLVVISLGDVTTIDLEVIQFIAIHLFAEVVEVPSADRWTDTEISVEAGQTLLFIGAELVKTEENLPWSAPDGHSPQDCAAAGRGDWDCRCRTLPEWGTCTMTETTSMVLVGRIGEDGAPFVVGNGGFFTAESSGRLYLGANDNYFEDNIGSYYVLVNAIDLTEDTEE